MSENFKKETTERPDRVLGDEWADWSGESDNNIDSGIGLFLFFSFVVVLLVDLALFGFYYLALPRFAELHNLLPYVIVSFILVWMILSGILVLQLLLTVLSGRNLFFFQKGAFILFDLVFTRVFKLAKLIGIKRDRMGHSFVLVSNAVVRAVSRKIANKKLMILLPRCLTKEALQEVYKLKEHYPVEIFTVSGGELARKRVKEVMPSAIIGVACERDLVSGIRDVGNKIPVIGLPNTRPNGPCKDTLIDVGELKKAVEFYLK
jgi:hypothetical protein